MSESGARPKSQQRNTNSSEANRNCDEQNNEESQLRDLSILFRDNERIKNRLSALQNQLTNKDNDNVRLQPAANGISNEALSQVLRHENNTVFTGESANASSDKGINLTRSGAFAAISSNNTRRQSDTNLPINVQTSPSINFQPHPPPANLEARPPINNPHGSLFNLQSLAASLQTEGGSNSVPNNERRQENRSNQRRMEGKRQPPSNQQQIFNSNNIILPGLQVQLDSQFNELTNQMNRLQSLQRSTNDSIRFGQSAVDSGDEVLDVQQISTNNNGQSRFHHEFSASTVNGNRELPLVNNPIFSQSNLRNNLRENSGALNQSTQQQQLSLQQHLQQNHLLQQQHAQHNEEQLAHDQLTQNQLYQQQRLPRQLAQEELSNQRQLSNQPQLSNQRQLSKKEIELLYQEMRKLQDEIEQHRSRFNENSQSPEPHFESIRDISGSRNNLERSPGAENMELNNSDFRSRTSSATTQRVSSNTSYLLGPDLLAVEMETVARQLAVTQPGQVNQQLQEDLGLHDREDVDDAVNDENCDSLDNVDSDTDLAQHHLSLLTAQYEKNQDEDLFYVPPAMSLFNNWNQVNNSTMFNSTVMHSNNSTISHSNRVASINLAHNNNSSQHSTSTTAMSNTEERSHSNNIINHNSNNSNNNQVMEDRRRHSDVNLSLASPIMANLTRNEDRNNLEAQIQEQRDELARLIQKARCSPNMNEWHQQSNQDTKKNSCAALSSKKTKNLNRRSLPSVNIPPSNSSTSSRLQPSPTASSSRLGQSAAASRSRLEPSTDASSSRLELSAIAPSSREAATPPNGNLEPSNAATSSRVGTNLPCSRMEASASSSRVMSSPGAAGSGRNNWSYLAGQAACVSSSGQVSTSSSRLDSVPLSVGLSSQLLQHSSPAYSSSQAGHPAVFASTSGRSGQRTQSTTSSTRAGHLTMSGRGHILPNTSNSNVVSHLQQLNNIKMEMTKLAAQMEAIYPDLPMQLDQPNLSLHQPVIINNDFRPDNQPDATRIQVSGAFFDDPSQVDGLPGSRQVAGEVGRFTNVGASSQAGGGGNLSAAGGFASIPADLQLHQLSISVNQIYQVFWELKDELSLITDRLTSLEIQMTANDQLNHLASMDNTLNLSQPGTFHHQVNHMPSRTLENNIWTAANNRVGNMNLPHGSSGFNLAGPNHEYNLDHNFPPQMDSILQPSMGLVTQAGVADVFLPPVAQGSVMTVPVGMIPPPPPPPVRGGVAPRNYSDQFVCAPGEELWSSLYLSPRLPPPEHPQPAPPTPPIRSDPDSGVSSGALNNQVSPGMRANNYYDNFRSFSRQNRLDSLNNSPPASHPPTQQHHSSAQQHGVNLRQLSPDAMPANNAASSYIKTRKKHKINREQNKNSEAKKNSTNLSRDAENAGKFGQDSSSRNQDRRQPRRQAESSYLNTQHSSVDNISKNIYSQIESIISSNERSPQFLAGLLEDLTILRSSANNETSIARRRDDESRETYNSNMMRNANNSLLLATRHKTPSLKYEASVTSSDDNDDLLSSARRFPARLARRPPSGVNRSNMSPALSSAQGAVNSASTPTHRDPVASPSNQPSRNSEGEISVTRNSNQPNNAAPGACKEPVNLRRRNNIRETGGILNQDGDGATTSAHAQEQSRSAQALPENHISKRNVDKNERQNLFSDQRPAAVAQNLGSCPEVQVLNAATDCHSSTATSSIHSQVLKVDKNESASRSNIHVAKRDTVPSLPISQSGSDRDIMTGYSVPKNQQRRNNGRGEPRKPVTGQDELPKNIESMRMPMNPDNEGFINIQFEEPSRRGNQSLRQTGALAYNTEEVTSKNMDNLRNNHLELEQVEKSGKVDQMSQRGDGANQEQIRRVLSENRIAEPWRHIMYPANRENQTISGQQPSDNKSEVVKLQNEQRDQNLEQENYKNREPVRQVKRNQVLVPNSQSNTGHVQDSARRKPPLQNQVVNLSPTNNQVAVHGNQAAFHGKVVNQQAASFAAQSPLHQEAVRQSEVKTGRQKPYQQEAVRQVVAAGPKCEILAVREPTVDASQYSVRTEAVRDPNTESVRDLNTESVIDLNTESVRDLNSESVRDLNTESVRDLSTEFGRDLNTESVRDLNNECVRDLNTESGQHSHQEPVRQQFKIQNLGVSLNSPRLRQELCPSGTLDSEEFGVGELAEADQLHPGAELVHHLQVEHGQDNPEGDNHHCEEDLVQSDQSSPIRNETPGSANGHESSSAVHLRQCPVGEAVGGLQDDGTPSRQVYQPALYEYRQVPSSRDEDTQAFRQENKVFINQPLSEAGFQQQNFVPDHQKPTRNVHEDQNQDSPPRFPGCPDNDCDLLPGQHDGVDQQQHVEDLALDQHAADRRHQVEHLQGLDRVPIRLPSSQALYVESEMRLEDEMNACALVDEVLGSSPELANSGFADQPPKL